MSRRECPWYKPCRCGRVPPPASGLPSIRPDSISCGIGVRNVLCVRCHDLHAFEAGVAHEYGFAVRKDQRLAARWHSLAASQDLPESHYHLGLMKAHGRGFAQDLSGAAIHFQKASSALLPCRAEHRGVHRGCLIRTPSVNIRYLCWSGIFGNIYVTICLAWRR